MSGVNLSTMSYIYVGNILLDKLYSADGRLLWALCPRVGKSYAYSITQPAFVVDGPQYPYAYPTTYGEGLGYPVTEVGYIYNYVY